MTACAKQRVKHALIHNEPQTMVKGQVWNVAPEAVSLGAREVQIWRVNLDRAQPDVFALARCLTEDEVARADRFRFARDRRRFVVARGVLRTLLGRVLSVAPEKIGLQYESAGKPALAAGHGSDVQFNVAHSHEIALVALVRGTALGVDVEYMREVSDAQRIARRFFSAQEVTALLAAPTEQQQTAFFRIWTRKEAFIKATGKGLSQPLDAFNVMTSAGQALEYVELDGTSTRWRLWDLAVGTGYRAALVVRAEHEPFSLRQYQYG